MIIFRAVGVSRLRLTQGGHAWAHDSHMRQYFKN
jgi:hypothetical protein